MISIKIIRRFNLIKYFEMTICKICSSNVSDGINLSDGTALHPSCLEQLQDETIDTYSEVRRLPTEILNLEHEVRKRDGLVFMISSIFSKPDKTTDDILKQINMLQNKINELNKTYSSIYHRLTSLYDLYLTYPPDWDTRKEQVIKRDGGSCSKCRRVRKLHLHHIKSLSSGGSNEISNLIILCEKCHSKQHGGKDFSDDFSISETAFSKRVSNIRYAIEHGERIRFEYKKPNETSYMIRAIKPFELVELAHQRDSGSTLCVSGYCELRKANRTFALKRMRGLKII